MTKESIIATMIDASKEDRERFFKVADSMTFQPKYKNKLLEIETLKQQWRDMPSMPNYPDIKFPLPLPDWFPVVKFASNWDTDYIPQTIAEIQHSDIGGV